MEWKTCSVEETIIIGMKLGSLLTGGDVVCLEGNLGTGKTAFTHGIAKALGIDEYITSPTFTIVNEYTAKIPLFHFDVYRIADPEEMFEIGFEEYLSGNGVVIIEWAGLIREILPEDRIEVRIEKDLAEGLDVRNIHIEAVGEKYKTLLTQLKR